MLVCARCGVKVGMWYYGWKHHNGGYGNRSCGQKPIVVEREKPAPGRVARALIL